MKRIIGIDFGTCNTSAALWEDGEFVVLPNERGNRLTPSVVGFSERGDVLVGESAKNQAVAYAERTIAAVKRSLGQPIEYLIDGKSYTPQQIGSFILHKVHSDAERWLGERVSDAVLTAPAHFSESQRRGLLEAGRLAGFTVHRIVNEPTAAALAYAVRNPALRHVLVYDFGGGTFDVTCLERDGNDFAVRASAGDNRLGGLDIDERIVAAVIDCFERESAHDLRRDPFVMQQIREKAEAAKIELSNREETTLAIPFAAQGHLRMSLSREELESRMADLIERTIELTDSAMKRAAFPTLDAVVLAGGSSRIPLVQRRLSEVLGIGFQKRVNPDEVVAVGAATYAAHFLDARLRLWDLNAYSLGVEIDGDRFVPLIDKDTPLPAQATKLFTTIADAQDEAEIHVLQGESLQASANHSLGRFVLQGIRSGRRGEARIEVNFAIDENALVTVSACDMDTRARKAIVVCPAHGPCGRERGGLDALRSRYHLLSASPRADTSLKREIEEYFIAADRATRSGDVESLENLLGALDMVLNELAERLNG